jgi:hypothetical protein
MGRDRPRDTACHQAVGAWVPFDGVGIDHGIMASHFQGSEQARSFAIRLERFGHRWRHHAKGRQFFGNAVDPPCMVIAQTERVSGACDGRYQAADQPLVGRPHPVDDGKPAVGACECAEVETPASLVPAARAGVFAT